jgi:hypothetical protein
MLPRAPTSKLVVRKGSECHGRDPNAANIVEWRVVKKRQSGLQTVALASIFLVRRLPCLGNKCLVVSLFSSPCAQLHPCPKHSTSLPGHLDEALANAATQSACPALLPPGRSRSQPALLCKYIACIPIAPAVFPSSRLSSIDQSNQFLSPATNPIEIILSLNHCFYYY